MSEEHNKTEVKDDLTKPSIELTPLADDKAKSDDTATVQPADGPADSQAQSANPPVKKQPTIKGSVADAVKAAKTKARTDADKRASFKIIVAYFAKEKCIFMLGMLFLILGQSADFSVPLFIGMVMTAMEEGRFEDVPTLCWQLFLIVIVAGVFVGLRAVTFNTMSEKIAKELRYDYYSSVINKDVEFYEEHRTGDLLSRLNADTAIVQDSLSTNVSMFVRAMVSIIASLIVLFILSPILAGTFLVGLLPIVIFSFKFGDMMRNIAKETSNEKAKMSTIADESLSNVRTVKAFANEQEEIRKFNELSQNVYKIGFRKAAWSAFFGFFTQFCLYGAMALIVYVASLLYERKMISLGTISSFLFYLIMLLFNFWILTFVFANAAGVIGASDKIIQIIQHKSKINTTGGIKIEDPAQVEGRIELRDVKFRYPSKPDVQVLKGINLAVDNKKNRVVALCGTSGCGKSSIIAMIERFYDPEEGEILFNGVNIKDINPRWYKQNVAIVQQEPVLFSGTIRENILYGLDWDDVSEEEKIKRMDVACDSANASVFIKDQLLFPLGYETVVGERGMKLSGGQKQRIAIARALIRQPKVLLLDEATSALDAESEHQVQQALDVLIKSGAQTTIIVAHRLSTIRDADEIIVMKHGVVMERGNHDYLVGLNGVYRNLVDRQMVADDIAQNL